MGLNPTTVLVRKRCTDMQKEEGHVNPETEAGAMQPLECQEPPEVGRGREGFSP